MEVEGLAAIADYVLESCVENALARETAVLCLMDSLAKGFAALKDAGCTRLLGPVVPGATLTGGARVPGTSYELDPINAAFNIGTLFSWPVRVDDSLALGRNHSSDSLGGILAVADYLSRSGVSLTTRDVFTAMIKAHEIQNALASNSARMGGAFEPMWRIRIATAAVVAGLLGGTHRQIIGAVSYASREGGVACFGRPPWASAEAVSHAVRLAFFVLKSGPIDFAEAVSEDLGSATAQLAQCSLIQFRPLRSDAMEAMTFHHLATDAAIPAPTVVRGRFESSVAGHFKAKQAQSICQVFDDRTALTRMPVSNFMAKFVSAC